MNYAKWPHYPYFPYIIKFMRNYLYFAEYSNFTGWYIYIYIYIYIAIHIDNTQTFSYDNYRELEFIRIYLISINQ